MNATDPSGLQIPGVDEGDEYEGEVVHDGSRTILLWEGKFGTLQITLQHIFAKRVPGATTVVEDSNSWVISLRYDVSPEHYGSITSIRGVVARRRDDLDEEAKKKIKPIATEAGWFIGPGCPEYSGVVPFLCPYRDGYSADRREFHDAFSMSRHRNLSSGLHSFIFAFYFYGNDGLIDKEYVRFDLQIQPSRRHGTMGTAYRILGLSSSAPEDFAQARAKWNLFLS